MTVFCAHLGYQFNEHPLPERFQAAADAGFEWVEHPSPYALGVEAFAERARAAGVGVAQIAAPAGNAALGQKGYACLPGAKAEDAFKAALNDGLDAAARIGARYLHIMSGVLPAEASRAELLDLYKSRISAAADRAAAAGQNILIEPIDDGAMPGFFMNDPWFALEVLRDIARPNAFLLFDVFHAHNRGVDLLAFWRAAKPFIRHIHIADAPGRHEPGTGVVDYAGFFAEIGADGYQGLIGCEYKPRGDTVAGLGWRDRYA